MLVQGSSYEKGFTKSQKAEEKKPVDKRIVHSYPTESTKRDQFS